MYYSVLQIKLESTIFLKFIISQLSITESIKVFDNKQRIRNLYIKEDNSYCFISILCFHKGRKLYQSEFVCGNCSSFPWRGRRGLKGTYYFSWRDCGCRFTSRIRWLRKRFNTGRKNAVSITILSISKTMICS